MKKGTYLHGEVRKINAVQINYTNEASREDIIKFRELWAKLGVELEEIISKSK